MDNRLHVSQYGQCLVVDELCYKDIPEHKPGYFIEIGAGDGYTISNTYWFEKVRDWKGLIVEPIPHLVDKMLHNRWCDIYSGAVYIKDGTIDFLHLDGYSEMISGIQEAYHKQYYERVKREIQQHDQKTNTINVKCCTLNTLISEFNKNNGRVVNAPIDFLSLDCQTAELHVLYNYTFSDNPCKVIDIDMNNLNKNQLIDWFTENGFRQHWKHQFADEYIFVNDSIKWSWESV